MDNAGKVIGVGSVKHGQGITSLVFDIAFTLANFSKLNVLIFDFNYIFGEMDSFVNQKTQHCIDDLISISKNQKLTEELLIENTEELKTNLRLVNPSKIDSADYLKKNADDVLKIINVARKVFDIIVVDTTAGVQSPISRLINSECDIFINVMTQNPYILEWYKQYNKEKDSKAINVINMFEESVYPNSEQIKKEFDIEHLCIAYSKQMRDYYNRKKIDEFVQKDDHYNKDTQELVRKIFMELRLDADLNFIKKVNTEKSCPFGGIKNLFRKS